MAWNSGGERMPRAASETTGAAPVGASYLPAYLGGPGMTYGLLVREECFSLGIHISYVVPPALLVGEENEFNAGVVTLIGTWKLHSVGLGSALASDVDCEAVCVKLWTAAIDWVRCTLNSVAVQSEELSAEDIHARFDIARQLEYIGSIMFKKKFFVAPELFINPVSIS
jgi:hypothetical protein